jgi:hypothetical protein
MAGPNGHTATTPRWVKVFVVVIVVFVLAFVVVRLTGLGGDHGPRRHASSGATAPGVPYDAR